MVVSVQALGSLLVVAVLVAPAACARLLDAPARRRCWRSASRSRSPAGVGGLYLSYYAGTAGGASIALCLVGAYLAALAGDAVASRR